MGRMLTVMALVVALLSGSAARASASTPVVAAVGDIACDPLDPGFYGGLGGGSACRESATAAVVAGGPDGSGATAYDAVLPLGDEQYDCGSSANFLASYDPAWGRFDPFAWPVPGNHEYKGSSVFGEAGCTADGSGYFSYFGARAAGVGGRGYYSYTLGSWHVVALNSNCARIGGCGAGSPEESWLRSDLSAHPARCTLAYWHHAPWSSTSDGGTAAMRPIWADLARAGADLVLVAHYHHYERFADLNASGTAVAAGRGTREIVVGTGGESLDPFAKTLLAASRAHDASSFGVLSVSLGSSGYSWRFRPAAGYTYSDSGSDTCH